MPTQAYKRASAQIQQQPQSKIRMQRTFIWGVGSILAGLIIWQIVGGVGVQGLPTPFEVATRFKESILDGTWARDTATSVIRVLVGFSLGSIIAIPLGFLMGWYRPVLLVVQPWVNFFRMVPPLAVIPLAIVILGIGEVPKIFVIFLSSFFACIIATYQGVVTVDKTIVNAAQVLGANDRTLFMKVALPYSVPYILVGMRTGLGSAWATVVAAELIAAQQGLGYRMQQAQLYYDLPTIFVSLITIGAIGFTMDSIIQRTDARLTSWQEKR